MKMKPQVRTVELDRASLDEETRTVSLSFSSEEPVERFFGAEVLDHNPKSARLGRINSGANLLINHRMDDWAGKVEPGSVSIGPDRKGRARVRFSKSQRGQEIYEDIKDGILSQVSFMYRVHEMQEDKKDRVFRVTDWEPMEISLVTIPADASVGVGRSIEEDEKEVRIRRADDAVDVQAEKAAISNSQQETRMTDSTQGLAAPAEADKVAEALRFVENASAIDLERGRKRAIENLAKCNAIDSKIRDFWIGAGLSIEQVTDDLLKIKEERGRSNPESVAKLDLSSRELNQFSLRRAILACAEKDWGKAGFELECSRAIAEKMNKPPEATKFYVPFDVLQRQMPTQQRDLTVASAGGGGYLVETNNSGFIDILRNRSVAFNMGATRLSGLTGNVTIPRQSAAATAYWLANEGTQITESQQTFVQVALTPKTVGAYTEISRLLLLQSSPSAEGIVNSDLAAVCALAVDQAALSGSGGGGQPTGLVGTVGIGGVVGTSIDYAKVLEFQTDVASANVMPSRGGYVTTPTVAALLMQRARFSNTDTPLWQGNVWDGQVSGFKAMSSNQMAAGSMLFGDWSELVIGEWGVLEVEVNPYANFQAGIIGVRAMYTIDIGVRRPFAFSLATSIT
jgi:HK97 family phage major capsid protein/HK97 family phage prohead protease